MNNIMANPNSGVELPDLFDPGQESSPKRFSWNDIRYYLNLLLRFRWALIIPFCLAMILGIYYSLSVTPIYEASTLVLTTPPVVSSNIVRPIASETLESQVTTISQQIKSRSNLEKIIGTFNLFSGPGGQQMFMEDKLERLRENIKVDLIQSRTRDGSNAFSISFRGNDPEKTMQIANTLASSFIDTNMEYREEKAADTTAFLESELEGMRNKLEETEKRLSIFRNQYMGELPEQLQSNLQLLASLETQLNNRQERLRDERSRLMIAQNEVEQIRRETQSFRTLPGSTTAGQQQTGGPMTLAQLKEQLASMQGSYTERHPDVVRLKGMIAEMEAKEPTRNQADAQRGALSATETLQSISSPLLREAVRRRMEAEANIASIQMEVSQINQQIRDYRLRIERTPQREEQLLSLKRDYENIQNAYNSLLSRKVEADMAVNIQRKNKGEQFRIIDYAKLPEKPVSPNMQRLFMIFVAAGLGIGAGILFLYEFFDQSVRKPEAFQTRLSLPVLMVMPAMELMPSRRTHVLDWLNNGLSLVGILVSLGLFACLAAVTVLNLPRASEIIKGILK
jgi:polysaccharide chain length determinant protein (PEP-CTERM system associated)